MSCLQKEFRDVVWEFVKQVSEIEGVQQIILYGSVARGTADPRSDIDFFIILERKARRTQAAIREIAYRLEKQFDRSIQPVFSDRAMVGFDPTFLEQIFREGLLLWSQQPVIRVGRLKLAPWTIFSFSLVGLSQPEKMRLKRALYGAVSYSRYRRKVYRTVVAGLVPKPGRLGRGAIMVERKAAPTLERLLRQLKVRYTKKEVWCTI